MITNIVFPLSINLSSPPVKHFIEHPVCACSQATPIVLSLHPWWWLPIMHSRWWLSSNSTTSCLLEDIDYGLDSDMNPSVISSHHTCDDSKKIQVSASNKQDEDEEVELNDGVCSYPPLQARRYWHACPPPPALRSNASTHLLSSLASSSKISLRGWA
jgi:hypothetical protein